MREDHAGQVHWKEYGKSDKLNAIGNKNEDFRAGYWHAVETLGYDAHKAIADDHLLGGRDGLLRVDPAHAISSDFLQYHRRMCGR